MARVAIVSYDVQTIFGKAGGVGAFCTRWANLLRAAGDDVTIVMTRVDWEPMRVDAEWRARYQMQGIGLIELQAPPGLPTRWPEVPTMRMAEIAAPVLAGFDIVYFQDWGNAAFHLVRERRYRAELGPVCVTVLHGPSEWELSSNHKYPELPRDLHLAYQERYAARHSDFVVSPSRYMADQLTRLGWEFPGAVEVLGLPMPEPVAVSHVAESRHGAPRVCRVVYFGRVEERKGIRGFVKAMQLVAAQVSKKPEVVLLGRTGEPELLESALRGLREAGYKVTHEAGLDSEGAMRYLAADAAATLCVVPSPADNHPYAVVEASLIPGLHVIACRGGGVPEILQGAARQLSGPMPQDLAALIAESVERPLDRAELAHYDCAAANARWLAFHRRALAAGVARARKTRPAGARTARSTVDVCTTYFQKAKYLGQFVEALEGQTEQDFHVIAVNDGSPDEASNRVFAEYAEKTKARGWEFFRQENAFVDAARNNAVRRGTGELLLFVDCDDVPAPNAVARMREAMDRSGDDAIICGSYLFASESRPVDPATGEVLVPAFATCVPLGMDLVGGLVNPCAFGGSMFMVKRGVFEAVGGYRELRGVGHEDWELYVRLALGGYKVDMLPELLQFYRQVEGSLARTLPSEPARRRLIDAYEQKLQTAGLQGGALALAGLYRSTEAMQAEIGRLSSKLDAPQRPYAFFSGASGRWESEGAAVGKVRALYRRMLSMETRLKLHKLLLAPFFGDYKPPTP